MAKEVMDKVLKESFEQTLPKMDEAQKSYILGVIQGISMMHENIKRAESAETKTA